MKSIFAALLVGFVAARTKLMAIDDEVVLGNADYFTATLAYEAEATYGTVFDQGVDSVDDEINYASYAFNVDATADASVTFEIAGIYKQSFTFTVDILDVTPYRQIIEWVNPEALIFGSKTSLGVGAIGEYDLYFLETSTTYGANAFIFSKSIADYFDSMIQGATDSTLIVPEAADFAYADDDITADSTYLTYDVVEAFNVDTTTSTWYGTQTIWSASVGI